MFAASFFFAGWATVACTSFDSAGEDSPDSALGNTGGNDGSADANGPTKNDGSTNVEGGPQLGSYQAVILQDKPVAYWRMAPPVNVPEVNDETAGARHLRLDGTFSVVPGLRKGNAADDAIRFDGIGTSASLTDVQSRIFDFDQLAPFTIEFWMTWEASAQTDQTYEHVINASDGIGTSRVGFLVYVERPSGIVKWEYEGRDSDGTAVQVALESLGPASAIAAHHYAMTFDGVNARFYVNGAQHAIKPITFSMPVRTGQLLIGRDHESGAKRFFPGTIDDIAIYDRALDAAALASHLTAGIH